MKSFLGFFLLALPFLPRIAVADIVIDIEEVSVVSSSLPASVSVGVFAEPGSSTDIDSFDFLFDIHQGVTAQGAVGAFPPDITFTSIANPLAGMVVATSGPPVADIAVGGDGTLGPVGLPGRVKLFDLIFNISAAASVGEVFDVAIFSFGSLPEIADGNGTTTFAAGTDLTGSITVTAVPEPSAFAFLGLVSSVCLGAVTWRRCTR